MKAYERFLEYAKMHTTSDEMSGTHPSSSIQFDLAHCLVDELKNMGILHIRPNICLIYKVLDDEKEIYLYDIGSHQDTGLTEDYFA